ncbi:ABC transporter permease [uncultured Paludibaculum sp.]|uniref:ABC transporter permease n=1 Tax=uncultured Paludibaculum sp. TaxID=1765020 RepID=UPI002AAAD348|nr:ABC transporter permease [uncultured Paludibaculum sp.]
MSWATVVAARLRGLFAHRRLDRELDEEVRFHLEMQIEDNLQAGMNPAEARYAALRSFGGLEPMKETYRERRAFALVETTAQDLRYAARTLRKSPGFTLTAVAVLALAIGASTAMFSVLNTVLLRPLPYHSPEQLAMLWTEDPTQNLREGRSALRDVEQWRSQSRSFADMATLDTVSTILTGADGTEQIVGASISPNLLLLLGVRPVLGRNFSTEEAEQRQPLVLISHRFWQARFGGSRGALGATLMLNGLPCQIIGILPADFQIARLDADVWAPHTSRPSARGAETWFVVGRLRPAVTFDQAQAEMTAIARHLSDQLPAAERNRGITVVPLSLSMVGPQSRLALWMLGGTVFCVFLIAAANVTSLSLARSAARGREMAVRAALGASAGRIMRQLLTEGILLAAVSGLFGSLLAVAGIRLIRAFGPDNLARLNEISLDLRVLGCALAISVLAGTLVGLAPAMTTLRRDLRPSGEEGGRSVSGGTATRRIRRALVVADFALAIVLLAGAGLLVRSWWYVNSIDPGFRPERVLVMELSAPPAFHVPAQRADLNRRVLEAIQAVPGVESAGIIGDLFIANSREQVVTVERADGTASERLRFTSDEVSADFFKTIGTPLLRGRFFSIGDGPDAPPVAIINDAMARRSWPEHDPVGRRFKLGPRASGLPWYTVVGVVADMRRQGLEREPFPQVFVSLAQSPPPRNVDLFIRTSSSDPLTMAGALRAAVSRVEKNAPVSGVASLEQQLGTYLAQRRFQTSLLTGFSIAALLMAAVGIYGLIQYSIATRTQEIGIRMAVGAQAGAIFRMILGEGLKLSLTGLMFGLLGAVWLGQAGSSLLFGVTSTDPLTFVVMSLLLIAVAVAACCFPARSAMKIEPIVALRQG